MDSARGKILSKIKFDGSLRGSVDEYLDNFEGQIEKVNKKLNHEKRYWANQARSINLLKAKQESQLKMLLMQHKKEIQSMLQVEAPPTMHMEVKQLPLIGKSIKQKQINFKWPSEKDLIEHDFETAPRLLKVKSKGVERSELTGLQMIFEKGIESTFVDAKHPYVKDTQTFDIVQGKKFTKVVARVFSGVCLTKVELLYDGGSQIIYDDHNSPYDYKVISHDIPNNHAIVGFYGRIEEEYICSFGLMVTPSQQ